MTRHLFVFASIALCAFGQIALGDTPAERTFTVVDGSETETEVTGLRFSGNDNFSRFDTTSGRIAVLTDIFQIAIPLENIVSIQSKEKEAEVTYVYLGDEKTITGTLEPGKFTGKSDFGDFELSSHDLTELKTSPPPSAKDDEEPPSLDVTLVLKDGTEVQVGKLKRHDRYYSTSGYLIGGSTRYPHYEDFRFLRGKSLATVQFSKIGSIDFGEKGAVTVTLKKGNKASGTISSDNDAGVHGFTGVNESGEFFIAPELVASIRFGSKQAEATK